MIINNTCSDIRMFDSYFTAALSSGSLHEDIADLFTIEFVEVDGERRMAVYSA